MDNLQEAYKQFWESLTEEKQRELWEVLHLDACRPEYDSLTRQERDQMALEKLLGH